jgi:glycosyltransferase involved in cell wall biosynthesis
MALARSARIGIDGTCLGSGRGYGRFLRELLPPLLAEAGAHEYVLFVDAETAARAALPAMPVRRLATAASQADAASARGARSPLDLLRMGRGVAREHLDAFYFPSVYSYFPLPPALPLAVAIHDTIPERHGRIVFPRWQNRALWWAKSRAARFQADTLITVSEYARRQIAAAFAMPAERIFVTPEAPSPEFAPLPNAREAAAKTLAARGVPDDPYFVYVGGFNPHKNVSGLVAAFAAASAGTSARLLLVGDYQGDVFHQDLASTRAEIHRRGVSARVHWLGFVPDGELRALYAGALAAVLPAFEEGFGLPAVEAAACGAPCIATRESPLPDVLAGGGFFFDPHDAGQLEAGLRRALTQPAERAFWAKSARERAAALSWKETARATRVALEATLERASR